MKAVRINSAQRCLDEAPSALERWDREPGGYTRILVSIGDAS